MHYPVAQRCPVFVHFCGWEGFRILYKVSQKREADSSFTHKNPLGIWVWLKLRGRVNVGFSLWRHLPSWDFGKRGG